MNLKGLFVSMHDRNDRSAYTHRLTSLARCLADRGGQYEFLYLGDSRPLNISTTASLFLPLWITRLREFHFIHCGDAEAGQALFFCRPLLRGPVILDIHGDVNAESALANEIRTQGKECAPDLRVKLQYTMATKCADHFLTVSNLQKGELVREGVPGSLISLIRNGVDLGLFSYDSTPSSSPFTFGYAGGFQSWQAIDYLIEAFAKLDDTDCRLLLLGFTEEERLLKEKIQRRLGSRVDLVDRTDQQSLIGILRSVSVLVIPRRDHQAIRHAFPTKFAEYAALGKPVMVNDVDETADFVRKYRCGFVASPSPDAMARTMAEASGTRSADLQEMGRRARTMAEENFSWEIIRDAYADCVQAVVDRFRGPRDEHPNRSDPI